jgi:signal transduction histidine kinase
MTLDVAERAAAAAPDVPPWHTLADGRRRRVRREAPTLGRAIAIFCLASSLALVSVVCLGLFVSGRAAEREALRDARETTDILATAVVQPILSAGLLRGDPAAVRAMDRVVRADVLVGPRVRIKIWTRDGVVVYSDERRLIGGRYALDDEEVDAMDRGLTVAELSDLSGPENRFERPQGRLLEVYRPIVAPGGERLLFETYSRYSMVDDRRAEVLKTFAPITIGALLLLQLSQLPLVWAIVRRLHAGQREREHLLRQAIDASADERRRIAGNVHDSVVQGLAGASFVIAGASEVVQQRGLAPVAAELREAAGGIRQSIRGLRSMLVEIYPPSVSVAGLQTALQDLIAPLRAQGIEAAADTPVSVDLPLDVESLVFRVAQESLRNVAEHSGARRASLTLTAEAGRAVLEICDDGTGLDVERAVNRRDGHVGMQVLRDLCHDAGALLEIASAPGRGTRIRLEVASL